MKIITVTLNPAFDVHCSAEHFEACHENLAVVTEREAGGKGVNISRALAMNNVKNLALLAVGSENGEEFCRELDKDGMEYDTIVVEGRIRENITIHTKNAPETRLSFTGFNTDGALLAAFEEKLLPILADGDVVTFTGRVPSGISIEDVKAFLRRLEAKGARLVIDSRSFSKDDLLDMKPWLIKPNEEEIGMYTDIAVTDFASAARAAEQIRKQGIENVIISSSKGAVLACEEGTFVAYAPKIKVVSTIGAGDSSIAGFIAAAKQGKSYAEMLRTAVSYGSAACTTEGTKPPLPDVVASCLAEATVERI